MRSCLAALLSVIALATSSCASSPSGTDAQNPCGVDDVEPVRVPLQVRADGVKDRAGLSAQLRGRVREPVRDGQVCLSVHIERHAPGWRLQRFRLVVETPDRVVTRRGTAQDVDQKILVPSGDCVTAQLLVFMARGRDRLVYEAQSAPFETCG